MSPDQIAAILRKHQHDGESDWSFSVQHNAYFSRLQAGRDGALSMPLSAKSGEIIAGHYIQTGILAEQDRRIHRQVSE